MQWSFPRSSESYPSRCRVQCGAWPASGGFLFPEGRGKIIDEAGLIGAPKSKHLRHAYLNVFDTEPLPTASPLRDLPDVLISPHNAGASTGTYARGVEIFLRNLDNYLHGRTVENEASIT